MNFSSRKIASPELRLKLEAWRSRFVLIFCLGAFVLLIGRSFYLQGFDNDFLQAEGEARYARVVDIPASRGAVMDRNGKALAISTPVESIWAAPSAMKQLDSAQVVKLAALLAMDTKTLSTRLADKEKNFVWVKRQMSPDQA
jgi:cell division protein FtsI (penicillin-binding protein 3)